jgi:hypothetical protein
VDVTGIDITPTRVAGAQYYRITSAVTSLSQAETIASIQ